jgi:hypothetical protein
LSKSKHDRRTKYDNPAVNKHFGLQIRSLQNAHRTVLNSRLQALLRLREREKEGAAADKKKIHKKVGYREIEMLKVAYFSYLKKKAKR